MHDKRGYCASECRIRRGTAAHDNRASEAALGATSQPARAAAMQRCLDHLPAQPAADISKMIDIEDAGRHVGAPHLPSVPQKLFPVGAGVGVFRCGFSRGLLAGFVGGVDGSLGRGER
jgi:hypothetical protein